MRTKYTVLAMKTAASLFAVAAAFVWLPAEASAYSTGITGMTVSGCTCHGNEPSAATTLELTSASGSFQVAPGETLTLTLRVSHASQAAAGLDVGIVNEGNKKAGTFSVQSGQGIRVSSGEVTHSSPQAFADGRATFTFTWTAPTTPGTYTLRAAGNAVNLSGSDMGDFYNIMSQTITVGPTSDVKEPGMAGNIFLHSAGVAPNPVSAHEGSAEIRYRLDRTSTVTMEVFDVSGRPVQPTETTAGEIGGHIAVVDTRRLAAGMYLVVLRAGNEQITQHFTVVR